MDALAAKIGIDPLELRRRNYIPTASYPYTAWSGLVYDSADHPAAADKAAALIGYDDLRQRQQSQNVDGATKRLGVGVSSYFEMCGLAPSRVLASLNYSAGGWEAATVRVLPTAKVQVVTGTRPARAGPRDGVVDDRRRAARDQPRRRRRAALRHGDRPARHGHLRITIARRRRRRHRHGVRPGRRQGQADRRPPARGERRRPDVRGRGLHRGRLAGQDDAARRHRLRGVHRPQPPRRDGAEPRGPRHLRPAQLLVAVRHAHVRRRGRHRDRRRRRPRLRRRRRLRRAGQPADRRGTGPRRGDPGARPGAVRGGRLRLRRQPADVDARRVPRAGGERRAVAEARPHRHAVADQPARRQGHRRGRDDRRRAGGDQRHRRRPVRPRGARRADAGEPVQRVEGDPPRCRRHGHRTGQHGPRRPPGRDGTHDDRRSDQRRRNEGEGQ